MKPIQFTFTFAFLCALFAGKSPADVFTTTQLIDEFHAEGASYGDINKDGTLDVVYGSFWFEGPEFTKRHLIYKPNRFAITTYSNNFMPYVYDIDSDGWLDVVVLGFPGRESGTYWYKNPGKEGEEWEKHVVFGGPGNESPAWADVDVDGKPEVVCSIDGQFGLIKPDWEKPGEPWTFQPISEKGATGGHFTHGLGLGDIDGDGLVDLLEKSGWWQQKKGQLWEKHTYPFADQGGAQMFAYDFDGDGDNDVITSLAAHAYGLAWFEHTKGDNGAVVFKRHIIMGSQPGDSNYGLVFSGLHGMDLADVDGDGIKDLITGTRYFAHNGNDPGDKVDPVIYWFRTVREANGVDFVPYLISSDAGVGTVVNTGDLNGDGRIDIIIGNKKGCFVHIQTDGEAKPLARVERVAKDEIEGESMEVLKIAGDAKPQNMSGFGAGVWSGDGQLWWTGAKPGDVLELAVSVAEDGYYLISAAMTKALDYGVVELSLDGKALADPIDCFQQKGVIHSGDISLGGMELKKGDHVLSAKITGANPAAVKGYMFGLDYLKLTKPAKKPTALFDGKSLDGWKGDPKWWRVEDGAIVGEIAAGGSLDTNQFLFWDGELHDFDLTLKYRISGDKSANSGVQLRCQAVGEGAAGYQADIDDGAVWTGRIYDEHGRGLIVERGMKVVIGKNGGREETEFRNKDEYAKLVRKDDWNDYRIRAVGPRIQTWINGHLASDLTDNQFGQHDFSGKLAPQLHSGPGPAKIEFKDIILTELGKTEPPKPEVTVREGISPEGRNLGFEEGTLRGWTATGEVWKESPIKGDTVSPRRPGQASVHDGEYWIGGYERTETDAGQGTLTSDAFDVTHPWGSFLIGAGPTPETRVEILDASGEVIFSRSGTKEMENLEVVLVDLEKQIGKQIQVRVVDETSGLWGHINFDDFRFHPAKPAERPGRVASNPILKHLTPNPAAEGTNPTVADMWVPEGFKVDVIATEPEVTQPIAFTFDERGRMWVAEAHSYPQRQVEGKGKDRIVIFEDTDGDGSFDKKTTFATGLNLVSGIEVGFGGVWVGAAPQFLFIPDENHDDKPDGEPVVLLDGWGYNDTHETLNSFIWGPDGWLYGNQGVFNHSEIGKPGAPASERTTMRAGVWRYHPQQHTFEIFATGCSNQWGIDFNEMGHMFITHCRSAWGGGPTTYVVQNGHYWNQSNSNHAPFISGGAAGWNPGSEKVFRNYLYASAGYGHGEGGAGAPGSRALYGGHSHVGTMIYLGGNWPDQYRNQLFTHNLHGHQMNRQINERRGSGYETIHSGADHLYTPDPRFIGVDLKYGPDGSVYMIDWYDQQHCHNNNVEVWDRTDGRIYRMAWTETFKPVKVNLREKSMTELVALVTSKNEWFSRTARRLLQERQDADAQPLLVSALSSAKDTPAVLRNLWALHLVGGKIPMEMLGHSDEYVRSWAVRLMADAPASEFLRLATSDPSAMVRLSLASALPTLKDSDRWALAEALSAKAEDANDTYLPKLIWYGIAPLSLADPERIMRMAQETPMPVLADSIVWYLSQDAAGREQIVRALATADSEKAGRLLRLMAFALPASGKIPAPSGWTEISAKLRNEKTAGDLDKIGGLFGDQSVILQMRAAVTDSTLSIEAREKALEFLKNSGDNKCAQQLVALLEDDHFRSSVLPLLGRFNDPAVASALLARFSQLKGADRNAALASLSSQPALATALLESIRAKTTDRAVLTSLHIRQMQNLGDEKVMALITAVWGKINETTADAKSSIAKFKQIYSKAPLWSYDHNAGAAVFSKVCATCHQMNGTGIPLGPDLTGSHANGVDYFIENIVDPNAVIGENFQLNIVTKNDSTVISGMPANESPDVLTIRTVAESVDIPKSEIKSRQVLEQSMMPSGLLSSITEKEAIELLKFLSTAK
jgi:putative membrane-bound dehydrogenase-like protein